MANDKSLELQIRIATQEALKAVASLKGEVEALADEAKNFAGDGGVKLKDSFKEAENAAKETSMSISDIKKSIGNLAEVVAATKALSFIKDMCSFALRTADNFQTARDQFGTLLGDMEAGAGLFNQIKEFNDKTPFDLSTLTQATNVLISAKVPLKDLQEQLTKFGDLSQGNSQRMTSYVNAFSQAAAKGKADMQVLNTYLHQGVPILDALAKGFGVTTEKVVEMSSQGKISFEDFSKALDDLTSAGGQYFGGMELASQSLAAMKEGLSEAVNTLAASFGDMLLPAAVAVIQALTDIANAINESPLLKGLLAGVLVALTGYLAAMAVKAGIAFAAQMSLNFAIGAVNPVVLAATIAVAGIAAGYVIYSAELQKAAKESENFSLALKKEYTALNDSAAAARNYAEAFSGITGADIRRQIQTAQTEINAIARQLKEKQQELNDLRRSYLEEGWDDIAYNGSNVLEMEAELERLKSKLEAAKAEFNAMEAGYNEWSEARRKPIEIPVVIDEEAARKAEAWLKQWSEQYTRFLAEQSEDPFALINLDREKRFNDALNNNINLETEQYKEILNQINEYYASQRSEVTKRLAEEEEHIQRDLSKTKIDNLEYELKEALLAIDKLETQRIIAAANSEEEIAHIRERFAQMREDIEIKFKIEIEKTKLDEARESVKNWQKELSDSLLLALMDLEIFSDQAAVIISDLSIQLLELSMSAALSGFEEFGRALGAGTDAAESLQAALASMCKQILQQLPMMFLQAGLQLIANGQWAMGLGFIAAAGSSAIISGYVDGASNHAQGGVFDEYGKAAREFAAGGTFSNQIVSQPTYFKYGGSLGVMGEAGPEAIMPLRRMPGGNLGVEAGSDTGSRVIINIINNSGAEVTQEESEDSDGNVQVDVMIGEMMNRHIASGKADRVMSGRYGLRAGGV